VWTVGGGPGGFRFTTTAVFKLDRKSVAREQDIGGRAEKNGEKEIVFESLGTDVRTREK